MNQSYEFMIPKEKGHLKGKSMNLFYVILTALPQEWNKETKHTCICLSLLKLCACEHSASLAMLMDHRVMIPKSAVLKKLQHRQHKGKEQTISVSKELGLLVKLPSFGAFRAKGT